MIFDVVQTFSGLSASYEARREEQPVGSAYLANNFLLGGSCDIAFLGEPYTLSYLPAQQVQSWFKPRVEKTGVPYQISKGGQAVGSICVRISEGNFLSRFDYYVMELSGREYAMYPVGLGKEGMKYPVYSGNTQIALLEKDTVVRDHLDIYHVSALDETAGLVSFLFGLYLDMREFANRGEVAYASYEKSVCYTAKKRLREKYDPGFKKRITK